MQTYRNQFSRKSYFSVNWGLTLPVYGESVTLTDFCFVQNANGTWWTSVALCYKIRVEDTCNNLWWTFCWFSIDGRPERRLVYGGTVGFTTTCSELVINEITQFMALKRQHCRLPWICIYIKLSYDDYLWALNCYKSVNLV